MSRIDAISPKTLYNPQGLEGWVPKPNGGLDMPSSKPNFLFSDVAGSRMQEMGHSKESKTTSKIYGVPTHTAQHKNNLF